MSSQTAATPLLHLLQQQLEAARQHNAAALLASNQGTIIQVPGTGKTISSAYEQLRNAAEYTEEHLLLQRAIRRFFHRNLMLLGRKHQFPQNLGEELIIELTQAGYLHNSKFGTDIAATIAHKADESWTVYWQLHDAHIAREEAMEWTLDALSVETESMLNPHAQLDAIAYVGYTHYSRLLPKKILAANSAEEAQYESCLYIAVHQSLFKSDVASIRYDLTRMYHQTPHDLPAFIAFNRNLTTLYTSELTQKLKRTISKYGAPLRILKSLSDTHPNLPEILHDRTEFLALYERQVSKEYNDLSKRLQKGLAKSIAFIFITKVIIGIGIEVPYDLIVVGSVSLLPLSINLLFPPLYMASLEVGLRTPSRNNANALKDYIDRALYSETTTQTVLKVSTKTASGFAKLLYGVAFFIPFAVTVYILSLLHFNIVQGIIFFAFLSTASFLGFRLARMIRDLEIVTEQQSFVITLRDFFYLPFILVGQWISRKYAKVNAIAFILDMTIELPLKTILRLLRQWSRFLSEKHDEIY